MADRHHLGYSEAVRVKRGDTWLLAYEELQISDEMVERAAHAIHEAESTADATAYNTGAWLLTAARAALTAALAAPPRKEQS